MKKFFAQIFQDEKNRFSSKRFIGIVSGLTLCITMYVNSYSHGDIKPSDILVNAVAMLSFGSLGLASVDKVFGKKKDENNEEQG
jgi:serine/threonine protein kinase